MKKILLTLLLGFLTIGVIFPNLYGDILSKLIYGLRFGAVSYPTSLDNFENPGATQSVATVVTHSTHHANHNDGIEALQVKVGITASTPITNSLFAGNGSGSSIWTTYATGTQAYFTNFFATGSSTLQNFTFANATGTQATTTHFSATTGAVTNFLVTTFRGAFSMGGFQINSLAEPSSPTDAATKNYVDSNIGGIGTVQIATSSTQQIYLVKGPISVEVGDRFLIFGKMNIDPSESVLIRYRQNGESASTTLDLIVTRSTDVEASRSLQGYYEATTTTTVWFDIVGTGSPPGNSVASTSLIALPLQGD